MSLWFRWVGSNSLTEKEGKSNKTCSNTFTMSMKHSSNRYAWMISPGIPFLYPASLGQIGTERPDHAAGNFLLLRMDLCTEVLSPHTHPTCGQIFFLRRKGITNEECLNHSTRRKHAMKESTGRGQQESAGNSWLRMRDCRKWPTDQRDREIPCRTTRITN